MTLAREIWIRGAVQGVGFRPFVARLAREHTLAGWVRNGEDGVRIHLEGRDAEVAAFLESLAGRAPRAASIESIDVRETEPAGLVDFTIRRSRRQGQPTTWISPDLPVCEDCLSELFDPAARRYRYPYINCTACGPRYSVILSLPYDRRRTTMKDWPLDAYCAKQHGDPADRRYHAEPIACPGCGPAYRLMAGGAEVAGEAAIAKAAELLRGGDIVAVKGIGGYHLACDGQNTLAVKALRERKYRKEKPFALMARDLETARRLVHLSAEAESLLLSPARPIVLAAVRIELPGVAPDSLELGVMLPYAPLHHLLFEAGAPDTLVMTSANRSNEPIAYRDEEALERLQGIADAFLIGSRPIARRVEDSVARAGVFGPVVLRRSRGYAPSPVAAIPCSTPILAVGADLKNAVTLVVAGRALVSQHIGDLDDFGCFQAFRETIADLTSMYGAGAAGLTIVHDAHPQYRSTAHALELKGSATLAVQHHRAHVASVAAERAAWDRRLLGVSFDGAGYGDDGSVWGGEFFAGSVAEGFARIAHLRPAALPGGDAAARHPVQAAAGFLHQIGGGDLLDSEIYRRSVELLRHNVRAFPTTSVGRLFDTAAALLGFTRAISYEGQAAMWVEYLARSAQSTDSYPFPLRGGELDYEPLLRALIDDRQRGRDAGDCARAFQRGVAGGACGAIRQLCELHSLDTVALSGGVFQNELLLEDMRRELAGSGLNIWTNRAVPPNDGGISLGQAALAAFQTSCTSFR